MIKLQNVASMLVRSRSSCLIYAWGKRIYSFSQMQLASGVGNSPILSSRSGNCLLHYMAISPCQCLCNSVLCIGFLDRATEIGNSHTDQKEKCKNTKCTVRMHAHKSIWKIERHSAKCIPAPRTFRTCKFSWIRPKAQAKPTQQCRWKHLHCRILTLMQ